MPPTKRLLFIGDSLIQFNDWQEDFPDHEVAALGVAGETVGGLLTRLDSIIGHVPPPDLISIMAGTNDIVWEDFSFLEPYGKIINLLSANYPATVTVVNGLPPFRLPWLAEDTVERMNLAIAGLCSSDKTFFLDLYGHLLGRDGCFLEDGVHLSAMAYRLWAEALRNLMASLGDTAAAT